MRNLVLAVALALGVGAGLAWPGGAQEARKYDLADTATVISVDAEAGRLTLRDAGGGERVFHTEGSTRVWSGGSAVGLGALASGDRVVVNARKGEGDRMIADVIHVVIESEGE